MTADDAIRVGDNDRSVALDRLGAYFADGYLTVAEFDERSGQAAVATTQAQLQGLFQDLPEYQAPAVRGGAGLAAEQELDDVLARNRKVQRADSIIGSLTLLLFFVGLFAGWPYFWAVFIVGGVAAAVTRGIYGLSDEDEDLAEELTKKQDKQRKKRLQQAAERRRELGH